MCLGRLVLPTTQRKRAAASKFLLNIPYTFLIIFVMISPMNHILVTGSLAFDYIMDYQGLFSNNIMPDKIHAINLSFLLNTLKKQRGGTAGNIAYNLALLQTNTAIFACAGNDFGEYGAFLKKQDIDTSNIQISKDKATASAFIMTDKADNQITGFYPGAMADAMHYSLKEIQEKPTFIIISPNAPQAIIKLSEECREINVPFMVDIGMQLPSLTAPEIKKIIQQATILIANDYEIDLLKKKTDMSEKDLFDTVKIIITTLGPKGSVIKTKKETYTIKAAKIREVLDPTGAGDAYRAGFMAGYMRNFDLQTCGQMGSVASAYAIEKYGTQEHEFTLEEFKKRYLRSFGKMLELKK